MQKSNNYTILPLKKGMVCIMAVLDLELMKRSFRYKNVNLKLFFIMQSHTEIPVHVRGLVLISKILGDQFICCRVMQYTVNI